MIEKAPEIEAPLWMCFKGAQKDTNIFLRPEFWKYPMEASNSNSAVASSLVALENSDFRPCPFSRSVSVEFCHRAMHLWPMYPHLVILQPFEDSLGGAKISG